MCGIIGYVGKREAVSLLAQGLSALEYRGYDSAGVAVLDERGEMKRLRTVGNFAKLQERLNEYPLSGTMGVGHTRWATHGGVAKNNAHPLYACDKGEIAIALNGIIENYAALKGELISRQHVFSSETDAEVVSHLIEEAFNGNLVEATRVAAEKLEGRFAFVVMHRNSPKSIVGYRRQAPLVVGRGKSENFIASAVLAFIPSTTKIQTIEDGEVVELSANEVHFWDADGIEVARGQEALSCDVASVEREGYETFMLKEIYSQPEALADAAAGRVLDDKIYFEELDNPEWSARIKQLKRILILSCGTSYHAGVAGRYMLEEWAKIPTDFDIASEWQYRRPAIEKESLAIGVSQSGETADTLAAMERARDLDLKTLGICSMPNSQITRDCDATLLTRSGVEISVAATKTFSAEVMIFALLAIYLGAQRGQLDPDEVGRLSREIRRLPELAESFLAQNSEHISDIAKDYFKSNFFLYLGRYIGLPVCLEGALKLKEIAYIPTEAYSAGEMKHGPIALLGERTPVVVVATDSHVYDKVLSNIQEVKARGARVLALASEGNETIKNYVDDVIFIPKTDPLLQTVLTVIPLQLFAYDVARLRGLPVDQPRNLAKTVTVE